MKEQKKIQPSKALNFPPPKRGYGGSKRTPDQRLADRALLEHYRVRGYKLQAIADIIQKERPYTITISMLSQDLTLLKAKWRKQAFEEVDAMVKRELAGLEEQEKELWVAWEKSKANRVVWIKERFGKNPKLVETKRTEECQVGDPQYMRLILEIRAQRRALLGLDKPQSVEVSGPGGGPVDYNIVVTPAEAEAVRAATAIPISSEVKELEQ